MDESSKRFSGTTPSHPRWASSLFDRSLCVEESSKGSSGTTPSHPRCMQFLKKNITATEVSLFPNSGTKALETTKIILAVGELESICFGGRGLSVLSSITNEKINVRHMEVMDIVDFSKEEAKKKEFMIRERLYMRNTGIFFLVFLGNTVFIPVIKIEVDRCMKNCGRFGKTTGIHVETNALVGNISPEIENAGEMKQKIGEIVTQKETAMKKEVGYQKIVFKEELEYEEQNEPGESEEQPSTGCQILEEFKEDLKHEEQREPEESSKQPSTEYQELCFQERSKRHLYCYDFSNYLYGNYED
ncbi:MAG: uncharacterized protein A8A55_3034 [Amphiamblys sp. WSBS2006]|nr:MAG: uncharacterized protein A8A55_3034 [Amphiamblys sp. WSBS2006]